MNRRSFLLTAVAARTNWLLLAQNASRPVHRLPSSDHHDQKVKSYVEDVPVAEYRWASEKASEAFRDIKYGVRIHWGLYSFRQVMDASWPFLPMSNQDRQEYQDLYKRWNPRAFDADEWMSFFAQNGLKMFAFTSKHHDGFSMYQTATRVKRRTNWTAPGGPRIESCDVAYSIMETPFRRDVVKELCEAARKRNIKIDLYFSHPDWYDADFRPYAYHPLQVPSSATLTTDFEIAKQRLGDRMVVVPDPMPDEVERMMTRHRAQLVELLTKYGKIDMVCLDQWLGPAVWPKLRETMLILRKIQPDVMFRARGIGNYGDYYTPEGFVPGSKENTDIPWFVIYPLASGFSFDPAVEKYKGANWIVRNLVDAVAKGGNFMVGIGPDGDGKFHPTAVEQIRQAGAWLKVNGEGIYATRARDGQLWAEGEDIRYTRTKDRKTVYAFSLNWPGQAILLKTVRPRAGSQIRMLGAEKPLKWRRDTQGALVIEIPPELQDEAKRPCRFAYGFRIEVEHDPSGV